MDVEQSLKQLSELFKDDDAEGILKALAELESKSASSKPVAIAGQQTKPSPPRAAEPVVQKKPANGNAPAQTESVTSTDKPVCAPFYYYKDYSTESDPDPVVPVTAPGRIPNFPAKMYAILSRPDLQDIVSWLPHGRSWRVHKPREFEVKVIPSYFEYSKYSSFIRQANGWGFRRIISKGPDRNSYYHEMFLRSVPHLLKMMKRPTPSSKPLADANTEPDLHKISEIYPLPELKDRKRPVFQATPQAPSHSAYIKAQQQQQYQAHKVPSNGIPPAMSPPSVTSQQVAPAPMSVPSNHQLASLKPCQCDGSVYKHPLFEKPLDATDPLFMIGNVTGSEMQHHMHMPASRNNLKRPREDEMKPIDNVSSTAPVTFGQSSVSLEMSLLDDVFQAELNPNEDTFWLD